MTQDVTALPQRIGLLEKELRNWQPAETDNAAVFVARLDALIEQTSEDDVELRVLFVLALEALQTVPNRDVEEWQEIRQHVAEALVAGKQYVLAASDPNRAIPLAVAGRHLLSALDRDPDEWQSLTSGHSATLATGEGSNVLSLDDAAALFMQLEPDEVGDLTRIRDALAHIGTSDTPYPEAARKFANEAAKQLSRVVQGKASDPTHTLTEVGWLIEGVLETTSQPHNAPPAPAADDRTPALPQGERELILLPDQADVELIADFITEARDYITSAETALLELEINPADSEAVNTVFRAFHTVKGTAAFLGLTLVSKMAHHAESLLSRMRDREIRCAGGYADLALRAVDMLKELVQALQDALGGAGNDAPPGCDELLRLLANPEVAGISEEDAYTPPPRLGDILVAEGHVTREEVEMAATMQGHIPLGIALTRSQSVSLPEVAKALRTQRRMASHESMVDASVRVRTERLDSLIDLVGELVIAHSMVAQDDVVLHGGHHDFLKKITHAGKIARELQDLTMSMRMVPFKATFQKMVRVVRDVAQKGNKLVSFITDGEDTEIDRHMVDIIADPLIHMVRNAVDHGIEPPDERQRSGKPTNGTMRLAAYHEGGNVVVELQDDGRGLNRDRIVEKAIARGLIESDKGMSDNDVFNLICEPGFSTAERVTDVSGRGVGMDVVKRGIESMKGRLDITSNVGEGTTFSIRLPLTLAITDGMLVKVGTERYIIPTINIYMSFRPQPGALSTIAGRGEMVMLRGELIPLIRLHRLFNIAESVQDPTQALLVVINNGEKHYGLLVDELLGQQQVVAKALGAGIGHVPGISGAAILGDGRVGLILDPMGIAILSRHEPTPPSRGVREQPVA